MDGCSGRALVSKFPNLFRNFRELSRALSYFYIHSPQDRSAYCRFVSASI